VISRQIDPHRHTHIGYRPVAKLKIGNHARYHSLLSKTGYWRKAGVKLEKGILWNLWTPLSGHQSEDRNDSRSLEISWINHPNTCWSCSRIFLFLFRADFILNECQRCIKKGRIRMFIVLNRRFRQPKPVVTDKGLAQVQRTTSLWTGYLRDGTSPCS